MRTVADDGLKTTVEAGDADTGRLKSKRPQQRARRIPSAVLANGTPVLLLLAWFYLGDRVADFILPHPLEVVERVWELVGGDLAIHTYTSFVRIVVAVTLAMVVGGLLVVMASLFPVTARLVGERFIPFMNSIPSLGWAILGVVWFGVSNFAVVFVVFAIILPFCMVNLWEGIRGVDRGLIEMGRSFTRTRLRVIRAVEAPLLVPYALAAVKLSFSVGWKVALIAEFFGARVGLGLVMNRARQSFDTPTVYATIVVVIVIVFVIERLLIDRFAVRFSVMSGSGAEERSA